MAKPDNPGITEYLTPAAVAAELSVSQSAVYSLIRSGDLPAVNLAPTGRTRKQGFWRVPRRGLEAFLSSRTVVPTPAPQPNCRRRVVMQIPNLLDS